MPDLTPTPEAGEEDDTELVELRATAARVTPGTVEWETPPPELWDRISAAAAAAAVAGDVDLVLLAVQVDAEALGEGFLVFDEQDARDGFARHERDSARGRVTTNRVPGLPSIVIAFTSPFISLTSAAAPDWAWRLSPRRPEISRPIW